MKYEKYLHMGAGVGAVALSFTADAMGIALSDDTLWMLRGFAVLALGLGSFKHLKESTPKKDA